MISNRIPSPRLLPGAEYRANQTSEYLQIISLILLSLPISHLPLHQSLDGV